MVHARTGAQAAPVYHPELRELLLDEARIAAEVEGVIPRDDPDWLRLPLARRLTALERIEVLIAYEKDEAGGVAAAEAAAAKLGVTPRQFYGILSAWRRHRTAWMVVPYAGRVPAKIPKLESEVLAEINRRIAEAARSNEARSPQAIVRRVLEDWPGHLTPPTPTTVRAHVERHIRSGVFGEKALRLNDSQDPQEKVETASEHGEVLVLDHTAPDIFIDDEIPHRPVLTLALDLHTRAPLGFALGRKKPSAELVLEALADAERRGASRASEGTIKPRLVLATTSGAEWRELTKRISDAEISAAIRWAPRLHAGGPTSRLIGSELARIPIKSRKVHSIGRGPSEFDRKRHPLLTFEQAKIVIADAVERLMEERLSGVPLHIVETGLFDGVSNGES